jgi:DDB1- and CUL4-associated factor 5
VSTPIKVTPALDTICVGHSSIVNATLIHPYFLHIVTAGIEKDIRLHSPTQNSPCCKDMELTPTDVRQLGKNEEADRIVYLRTLAGFHTPDALDYDEDPEQTTIMMFDQ